MVNKIPWLANFQSKLEHSSIPIPALDGVAAGCHSSLHRFAVFFKTTTGLHTNSQASGDCLVKVTTSSVLCGLWRSQSPLGLQILRSGVRGTTGLLQCQPEATCGQTTSKEVRERAVLGKRELRNQVRQSGRVYDLGPGA